MEPMCLLLPVSRQFVRDIYGGILYAHRARCRRQTDQSNGRSWDTQADADLRAYRYPVNVSPKRTGQKVVLFVVSVETDLLTQQAGTDAEFYLLA